MTEIRTQKKVKVKTLNCVAHFLAVRFLCHHRTTYMYAVKLDRNGNECDLPFHKIIIKIITSSIAMIVTFTQAIESLMGELVVGSRPCSETFFILQVFPILKKQLPKSSYSRLPITQTLANSNLALTRTIIDFPWTSVIHSL